MTNPTGSVTDLLTEGAVVLDEDNVPDELPEAFTEPLNDGEGAAHGDA